MNDDQQPEDIYEDEDDENSENNWRNEYPEEESSDGDEDSRGKWLAALDGEVLVESKTGTVVRSILTVSLPLPLSFISSTTSCWSCKRPVDQFFQGSY